MIDIVLKLLIAQQLLVLSESTTTTTTGSPVCTTSSEQSELNSFLWTLKRDAGPPAYFFGTIHVPYTRVWNYIPQNAKNAFRYSENIFFELDLTDGATASALAECQLLPGGQLLSDIIPTRLFKRVKRHMEYIRRKIPDWMGEDRKLKKFDSKFYADYQYRAVVGNWNRMRPVWLVLMLNSLTENDIRLFGIPVLDLYLSRQAVQWGKRTGAIERVDEQCEPLNRLNSSQVIFALEQTIKLHEDYRRRSQTIPVNDALITHYNCGDLSSVLFKKDTVKVDLTALRQNGEPNLVNLTQELEEYFQKELLYKRNIIMADRIIDLLQRTPNESYFFAFGAGHFLGKNSVINRLQEAGLKVVHTPPESAVQSHSKRNLDEKSFSHMDSQSLFLYDPYLEAMRRLKQFGSGGRHIRHGRQKKNRKNFNRRKLHKSKNLGGLSNKNVYDNEIIIDISAVSSQVKLSTPKPRLSSHYKSISSRHSQVHLPWYFISWLIFLVVVS